MCTDYNLLQVEDIVEIHQYPTTVNGYAVWETEWMSDYDENGKFNRYRSYGPFSELAELLECLGLLDNKIAIKYKSGLFIGFYDGQIRVGNRCTHLSSTHYIKSSDEILERYNSYVNRCKELNQRRKF